MRQPLASGLGMLAFMLTVGCASKPTPPPAQPEVPIRTQEEVARDEASSAPIADPAQCASRNPPPNCPPNRTNDSLKDTRAGQRLPRMLGK